MWLLVRERGRRGRYFRGSRKFGIASAKKLARKVSSDMALYSERAVDCSQRTFSRKPKIWNRFSEKTNVQSVIRHGPLFRTVYNM